MISRFENILKNYSTTNGEVTVVLTNNTNVSVSDQAGIYKDLRFLYTTDADAQITLTRNHVVIVGKVIVASGDVDCPEQSIIQVSYNGTEVASKSF